MIEVWIYSLISVILVSIVSLVGVFTLALNTEKLKSILIYLVSLSAGVLFGGAFLHLLPEAVQEAGFGLNISLYLILGIAFSFSVEKIIRWRHCHLPITKTHIHPLSIMNLVGDAVHNFIDGLIIGVSYLTSISLGIATTTAVIFHEIPQEIADFGVLLHGGFTKGRALLFNFLIALTAVLGLVVSLLLGVYIRGITLFLLPFAAGNFIYIAGSDLIPELHKECAVSKSLLQLAVFVLGVLIMLFLRL